MSESPTTVLLRVAAQLREYKAFDSTTLRDLAKSANDVDLFIAKAKNLGTMREHAFSGALRKITRSTHSIDWKEVRKTLRQWSIVEKQQEAKRQHVHDETAPIWLFKFLSKPMLAGRGAQVREAIKVGNDDQRRYLLRIAEGPHHTLLLVEKKKLVAEYSIEPGWSPDLSLTLQREGRTFVPFSRLFGPAACRLVQLEDNQVIVEKQVDNGWIQPVGLVWHSDKLLFFSVCQLFGRGINRGPQKPKK
jgi:hypothetical protein